MANPWVKRLEFLLLTFVLLNFSQGLSLLDSPTLTLDNGVNTTNNSNVMGPGGTRVPGRSPFTYVGNPALNLLRIDSLQMSPNPCTL